MVSGVGWLRLYFQHPFSRQHSFSRCNKEVELWRGILRRTKPRKQSCARYPRAARSNQADSSLGCWPDAAQAIGLYQSLARIRGPAPIVPLNARLQQHDQPPLLPAYDLLATHWVFNEHLLLTDEARRRDLVGLPGFHLTVKLPRAAFAVV